VTPEYRSALDAIACGRIYPDLLKEGTRWCARWRAFDAPENRLVDRFVRKAAIVPSCADAELQRHETLHDAWLAALRSRTGIVNWDDAECREFSKALSAWHGEADGEIRRSIVFRFTSGENGFDVSCDIPKDARSLKALGEATFVEGALRSLRKTEGGRLSVPLSREDAGRFVSSGVRRLEAAGYRVEGADISCGLEVGGELDDAEGGQETAKFTLVVRVAGEPVSAAEVKFLLDQGSSLVFFRGRWIEVDRNILKCAYRALEKNGQVKLRKRDALRFALGLGRVSGLDVGELKARGWLRGLVGRLRATGAEAFSVGPIEAFRGELRDYQARGVVWMKFLTDNGFGALLADDMGLGKTVEAIAWMLASGGGPYLVVAPLTLLSNWRHELSRFAPGLKVMVHQGDDRAGDAAFAPLAERHDVVLVSYSLVSRDLSRVSSVRWRGVVLDEAQAVKNAATRLSAAVRSLDAERRVALTGTPVENSALDVWGIEEFLNPGFLGPRAEFARRFVALKSATEMERASAKLRHALEPFVLRRLKSDPAIGAQLGEKRFVDEYCELGADERREYEDALSEFRFGQRRKGDALRLITRLKLVCDGKAKLERLLALVEEIFASGESVLVFSQYVKVGEWRKRELEKRFSRKFQFLHGALGAKERERRIAAFSSSPAPEAFILSLRTGGFGLNLVKAAHVVHFDRWWNPAVENQATDRTHRIGQTKTVFVHRMISSGTIEERVHELLESKSALASGIVAGGESYLMKLEADELVRISELR
jgi:superfamily II DNA or RNA helicase